MVTFGCHVSLGLAMTVSYIFLSFGNQVIESVPVWYFCRIPFYWNLSDAFHMIGLKLCFGVEDHRSKMFFYHIMSSVHVPFPNSHSLLWSLFIPCTFLSQAVF